MNPVFAKTRELAEAIKQSEEYLSMKEAEERALKNEEAAAAMTEYLETRREIEALLEQENPDRERLNSLSERMDMAQRKMQLVPDVAAMSAARESFSELINQVNRVLRFIITGETGEADEPAAGGCSGGCASCGGCGHRLN